jgi:hypothetical protein
MQQSRQRLDHRCVADRAIMRPSCGRCTRNCGASRQTHGLAANTAPPALVSRAGGRNNPGTDTLGAEAAMCR